MCQHVKASLHSVEVKSKGRVLLDIGAGEVLELLKEAKLPCASVSLEHLDARTPRAGSSGGSRSGLIK
jgi:hypothetical protein